ncbi:hypothetical protein CR513_44464, partial [Mucuna pruriens]
MFIKSIDASEFMKIADKVYQLLNSFVEEIGKKIFFGKLLQATRTKLFWTSCVVHCLDLMLEEIGKIAKVKKVIQRGIKLVGYVYNHSMALNTMRKFTNKSELVRHSVTRFATTFLTLQRLHKQKANLRRMTVKDPKGKKATNIVLMPSFWNVVNALKAMGPIIHVLMLVDNEKRPAMGYIYKTMDRAKEAIQKVFNDNEDKYEDNFAIIDRWDCQLHRPLHVAGYFLNPEFFYSNSNIEMDYKVLKGLYQCIDRLSENDEFVDHIHNELPIYKRVRCMFGFPTVVRKRMTMALAEWWSRTHTPHLQNIVIKVLSLTCSSLKCEHNWSTFEHIYSKRSRLEHQKLQDLVYVKYNQALHERYECRNLIDPIALKDIDDNNEWIVRELDGDCEDAEDELIFDDDILTWRDVASATEAVEPLKYTRRQTQMQRTIVASTSKKEKEKGVVEEEDEDESSQDEGEEEYNSSSNRSDEDNDMKLEEDEEDY